MRVENVNVVLFGLIMEGRRDLQSLLRAKSDVIHERYRTQEDKQQGLELSNQSSFRKQK